MFRQLQLQTYFQISVENMWSPYDMQCLVALPYIFRFFLIRRYLTYADSVLSYRMRLCCCQVEWNHRKSCKWKQSRHCLSQWQEPTNKIGRDIKWALRQWVDRRLRCLRKCRVFRKSEYSNFAGYNHGKSRGFTVKTFIFTLAQRFTPLDLTITVYSTL